MHAVTELPAAHAVLAANPTAIIIAVLLVALIVFLLVSSRRKPKAPEKAPEAVEQKPTEPARPKSMPASKEVFAPLPPVAEVKKPEPKKPEEAPPKAEQKAVEPEVAPLPEGETPWELMDEEELAAARKKKAEAEAKAAAEARKKAEQEAERERKRLEAEAKKAAAATGEARAEAAPVDADEERRKADEKERKRLEAESKAEAARAAEARDKALKESAERAKAEKKRLEEEEAKAKAEARRKEAEAKAAVEKKKQDEEEARAAAEKKKQEAEEAPGKTLKDGLGRTRKEGFIAKLSSLFAGKQIDQDLMDEVEEALFTADIGVRTADRLLQAVREALSKKELKDASKVWEVLRGEAQKILEGAVGKPVGQPAPGEPFVTMVLGVNGTGKTTSIGKLAHKLIAEKRTVVLVAGDTFRAAAAEQLDHWARRVGAPCIKGKDGADPASVVFDGVKQGLEDKAEFVLVDTAGRLHNNVNLMEELKKVRRVMGRAIPTAPHEVLMVLDATTGQNGIAQAKQFKEATDVTGIILTKLDGTAKGGVVLGVCDELKIPIKWIGVGERVSDLRAFDPKEFVDELFAPPA